VDSTISIDQYESCDSLHADSLVSNRWRHLENLEQIGEGRFGQVYRAWDALLERQVALKLCRRRGDWSAEWSQLGLQEARSLACVRHPNVVTVYAVGHHEGRLGIWMEYLRGQNLDVFLRALGLLGGREASLIGLDLCSSVAAAHALGLLHRDIKTRNVMREEGGRIVLLDFGLSQNLRDGRPPGRVQPIRGTLLYMAPELLHGEPASIQSDIFGIGVLLYHLVTGSFPAGDTRPGEIQDRCQREQGRLLRDRRADLPEPFFRAIERALAPDPAQRFATAGQMAQALSESLMDACAARLNAAGQQFPLLFPRM